MLCSCPYDLITTYYISRNTFVQTCPDEKEFDRRFLMRQRQLLLAILYNLCVQIDRCFFIKRLLLYWSMARIQGSFSLLGAFWYAGHVTGYTQCAQCYIGSRSLLFRHALHALPSLLPLSPCLGKAPKTFSTHYLTTHLRPSWRRVCCMHRFPSLVNINQSSNQNDNVQRHE